VSDAGDIPSALAAAKAGGAQALWIVGDPIFHRQLRHSAIVALISESLAEEENADQLLNQVARTLMSVAKMPAAIEQTEATEEA
jgi:hypothetical protein